MFSHDDQEECAGEEETRNHKVVTEPVIFPITAPSSTENAAEVRLIATLDETNWEIIPGLPNEISIPIINILNNDSLKVTKQVSRLFYKVSQNIREKRLKNNRLLWRYLLNPNVNFEQALKNYLADVFQEGIDDIRTLFVLGRKEICGGLNTSINQALISKTTYDCLYNESKFLEWMDYIQALALTLQPQVASFKSILHQIQYCDQGMDFLEAAGQLESLMTLLVLYFKMRRDWKGKDTDHTPIVIHPNWNKHLTGRGLLLLDDYRASIVIRCLVDRHERLLLLQASSPDDKEIVQTRLNLEAVLDKMDEELLFRFFSTRSALNHARIILASSYLLHPGRISNTTLIQIAINLDSKEIQKVFTTYPAFIARLYGNLLVNLIEKAELHQKHIFAKAILSHSELINNRLADHQIVAILRKLYFPAVLEELLTEPVFLAILTSSLLKAIAIDERYAPMIAKNLEAVKKIKTENLIEIIGKNRLLLSLFLQHAIVVEQLSREHLLQLIRRSKTHALEIARWPDLVAKFGLDDLSVFDDLVLDNEASKIVRPRLRFLKNQAHLNQIKRREEVIALSNSVEQLVKPSAKNNQKPTPPAIVLDGADTSQRNVMTTIADVLFWIVVVCTFPISIPLLITIETCNFILNWWSAGRNSMQEPVEKKCNSSLIEKAEILGNSPKPPQAASQLRRRARTKSESFSCTEEVAKRSGVFAPARRRASIEITSEYKKKNTL